MAGTGALGRLLGLDEDSGIRFGGLWIGDASGVLSGGLSPGHWCLSSLTIADLSLDTEKLFGWSGGSFGTEFLIGEIGYSYRLGALRKPGNLGVGVWGQTGKLATFSGGMQNGANGVYLFGSQRLWFRRPGLDSSGVSGFYQFGANNSSALLARQYVGGGLTAFGLVPGRPDDTFGFGLAWTWLNRGDGAGHVFFPDAPPGPLQLSPSQLMLAWYYQMKLVDGCFFQTTLTDIPNPGMKESIPNALAISFRLIVLF